MLNHITVTVFRSEVQIGFFRTDETVKFHYVTHEQANRWVNAHIRRLQISYYDCTKNGHVHTAYEFTY